MSDGPATHGPRPAESDAQALHDAAVLEMLADDLVDVVLIDVGVPDSVGVDHGNRPLLAAIEAARLVDANLAGAGKLEALDAVLGVVAHLLRAAVVAALLAVGALVAAEEDVALVIAHVDPGALPELNGAAEGGVRSNSE